MLIDTLFLVLRELLPLFFLLSMLCAILPEGCKLKVLGCGLSIGLLSTLLVHPHIPELSQWRDGSGLEIFLFSSATLQLICFGIAICQLSLSQRLSGYLYLACALGLLLVTCSTNAITYFNTFVTFHGTNSSLFFGTVIGIGVSASLATLCFFGLRWCKRHGLPLVVYMLPALFFTGHFAKAFSLLEQIGMISGSPVWSTQRWLPEQSEIAQILSSFFGYEATPSDWQIVAFVLMLTCLILIICWQRKPLQAALTHREMSPC